MNSKLPLPILNTGRRNPKSALRSKLDYPELLSNLLQEEHWQVKEGLCLCDTPANLVISRGNVSFIVVLKTSSEGVQDRLVPLLAQAILEARTAVLATPDPVLPLAVVAAPVISPSTAHGLVSFRYKVAPDFSIGIFDRKGFIRFEGSEFHVINAAPLRPARRHRLTEPESADLFTDANQWMMKVLLAPLVPDNLLQAPRAEYRDARALAAAARVPIMPAVRFVRQLRIAGFLDYDTQSLRLINRKELMRRWQAANQCDFAEIPLRWIKPSRSGHQLQAALRDYSPEPGMRVRAPRACLGLSEAARSLEFGAIRGIPPYLYIEYLDWGVLDRLGLTPEDTEISSDVYVRVLRSRDSIFNAAVVCDGVPVADILQVWLDIDSRSGLGQAKADKIRRDALWRIFEEES
jgi:hypothetical protein